MKLPIIRNMGLFRRRDKHKIDAGSADPSTNGSRTLATDQRGLLHPNGGGMPFAASDVDSSSSSRRLNFRGKKRFGGNGSAVSGSGNSHVQNRQDSMANTDPTTGQPHLLATAASARALDMLSEAILARVFSFVCPHSQDRSYDKCEESCIRTGCMLCDMRDLAHCAPVCRRWRPVVEGILYTSIRIDSVHYCAREGILADKRKRRSFFDCNGEPEDTADARLKLLCRTLRTDATQRLGRHVQFLKIPYMLRESRHADLARTISVLSNLRYADLPEGLFMDDPIYVTLKLEIQAKCPDLRKMTYMSGAERSLEALAAGHLWHNLEVLELIRIAMDPSMLRRVLVSLPSLRALKVTEARTGPHSFSDEVLVPFAAGLPLSGAQNGISSDMDVPPLEELVLVGTRHLTVDGLLGYLSGPPARATTLRVLTLDGTGVKPWALRAVLAAAPSLQHLTVVDDVVTTLPVAAGTKDIQPLASTSLRTLHYEIKTAATAGVSHYAGVTRSYYNYLSGSILSGGLPRLRAVYVRDAQFPESLLEAMPLPPPPGTIGGGEFVGGPRRPTTSDSSISDVPLAMASPLRSPASTRSLGPAQSPMGFLSPHPSPGFWSAAAASPGTGGTSSRPAPPHNPFVDARYSSKSAFASSSPPVSLVLGAPRAPRQNPRFSSNNPFAGMLSPQQVQTLEVFTKGDDDLDWSSIVVNGGGANGGTGRPASSYGLRADLGTAGARKSILISTGAGNFLALPDAGGSGGGSNGRRGSYATGSDTGGELWPRPRSSAGERRSEKLDLWR